MARIYYGVPSGHTGATKQQMFKCNRPLLYKDNIVYMIDENGVLYTETDLNFCRKHFPAIKIYLFKMNKCVSVSNFMHSPSLDSYAKIGYIDDLIQLNPGVATKNWGSDFRSMLPKVPVGANLETICAHNYTNITFEDVPDAQMWCAETEEHIKYLLKAIQDSDKTITDLKDESIAKSKALSVKNLYEKEVCEQDNRKVLLSSLKCKLDFNARRTWAPYITKSDSTGEVVYGVTAKDREENKSKYIKTPKTKQELDNITYSKVRNPADSLDYYEEKYGDVDKLTVVDFVLAVNNPVFARFQDSYSIHRGIDHIDITVSIRSVGLTPKKQIEAYYKLTKDIDRLVARKISKHPTFKSSTLQLSYFKVHREITRWSTIEYSLDLKPEYLTIKQDHLVIIENNKKIAGDFE